MSIHIYTQEEFDNLPIIDGIKQCPTGDYSIIRSFAKGCSFAERCSFAKGCSFGEWCSFAEGCRFAKGCRFENDYEAKNNMPFIQGGYLGSRNATLYIYNFKQGIYVRAGCWFGTIEEFKERICKVYDNENKYHKQYALMIQLAQVSFG